MKELILKEIKGEIEKLDFADQIQFWNSHALDNYADEFIWQSVADFAEDNDGIEALELARKVYFGKIDSWGDPVCLNGYGNLETVWALPDVDLLATWIYDQQNFDVEITATFEGRSFDFDFALYGEEANDYYDQIAQEVADEKPEMSKEELLDYVVVNAEFSVNVSLADYC